MKVYVYYSKNKILRINNQEQLKSDLAKVISREFDLFNDVKSSDVIINCVKISNEIDMFLIVDTVIGDANLMRVPMERIKQKLEEIVHNDQKTNNEYKIRTKVDPAHKGTLSVASDAGIRNTSNSNVIDISNDSSDDSELDYEKRSKQFVPVEPSYSFERVILPEDVVEKLEEALSILKYEKKVFEEWGLYEIQPHPSSSLSFFGPSGTGKTMAAEAVANKMGKKILKISYADVESKFHGEGPKMVKAIFLAAEKNDAVLFFDEADSLLSKRLTNVTQGSEQAINSMRSQLLICLEEFRGIVIFATNLVVNYDSAFLTRLISVEFTNPDAKTREKIWNVHIKPIKDNRQHRLNIPLAGDVNTQELANQYEFAGREIRNAVISACISVAMSGRDIVRQADFIKACDKIVQEKKSVANASDHTISDTGKEALKKAFIEKIKEQGVEKKELSLDNIGKE